MWTVFYHVGGVLLLGYLGWAVVLFLMQARFVYRPVRDIVHTPDGLCLDYEDVVFESEDGVVLNGWWIPAGDSRYTVLYCHGNGGNMMHRLDSIQLLNKLGVNCFIFDYRGYGRSEGKPSEKGTYLDALAAYKWLTRQKKIHADSIIVFGRSLGGSIAAQLAGKVRPRGLVIESCFTSYAAMGARFYPYMPVRWFARFRYKTVEYVKQIHCPVLIMHSRNDEVVPFEFGRELYEAAKEPKEFVEIVGGHNDGFLLSADVYNTAWKKWLKFLAEDKDLADQQTS